MSNLRRAKGKLIWAEAEHLETRADAITEASKAAENIEEFEVAKKWQHEATAMRTEAVGKFSEAKALGYFGD
jgi:hypothetical protein